MSTPFGIRRLASQGGPIAPEEIERLIAGDPTLRETGRVKFFRDDETRLRGSIGFAWSDPRLAEPEFFGFEDGEIWTAGTPRLASLEKMKLMATMLGATVTTENESAVDWKKDEERVRAKRRTQLLLFLLYALAIIIPLLNFFLRK